MDTYQNNDPERLGNTLSFDDFKKEVLADYHLACLSREVSLIGRKEVLTGKAKFGIFGDGKEIPQIAWAKFFKPGDWRSGYYRDQTFAFASGLITPQEFFAQLFGDPTAENEPSSYGRQMNAHFSSQNIDENGNYLNLAGMVNVAAGTSPTSSQMPRSLGLAFASKLFREVDQVKNYPHLSHQGDEICFATIGDAATSEGHFWETVNAAAVLQVPLAILVWDDGYGISVPTSKQTVKGSISEALAGFEKRGDQTGIDIYTVKGWDYADLCEVFERGIERIRKEHIPAIFHVQELTQPQGHSTSGSHERYKSTERLEWEKKWDCNLQFRHWILANSLATEEELQESEEKAHQEAVKARDAAFKNFQSPIKQQIKSIVPLIKTLLKEQSDYKNEIKSIAKDLISNKEPLRRDILHSLSRIIHLKGLAESPGVIEIQKKYDQLKEEGRLYYNTFSYAQGANSATNVPMVDPTYEENAPSINGFEILNKFFDQLFENNPKVFAFGEDVGKIGGVNQAFHDLQKKYGQERIFDTGIRELTIVGQATGMALRGLRPIAEIQYLDYILFALQQLSDDVSTLQYRTKGMQCCPLIIRTRGHRLEGIWHSGSPMGILINALKGMYVCVPRNMTQAAGMYNTLLKANEPGIVIECLNGYRLKERLPSNLGTYTVPMGIPEILQEGEDITIVSYGSTLRIAQDAIKQLEKKGISCELIDVQTLLPFDRSHKVLDSLKKTSRILFLDEDMPSGGTAYMFKEVIEKQGGYRYLDAAPRCLSAKPHRPAYGSDGDYFSKPNAEDIYDIVSAIIRE